MASASPTTRELFPLPLEFLPSVQLPASLFPPALGLEGVESPVVESPVAESPATEVRTGSFPFPLPPCCFTTIQLPLRAPIDGKLGEWAGLRGNSTPETNLYFEAGCLDRQNNPIKNPKCMLT